MRRFILTGTIAGLSSWIAYWVVESFLVAVVPRLLHPSDEYIPVHAGFGLFLLTLYAVAGALTGGLIGAVCALAHRRFNSARTAPDFFLRLTITLGLTLAVAASVLPHLPSKFPLWCMAAIAGFQFLTFAWSFLHPEGPGRFGLAANPWSCAALLLVPVWAWEYLSLTPAHLALLTLVLFLAAVLLSGVLNGPAFRGVMPGTGCLAIGLLVLGAVLHQQPRITELPLRHSPPAHRPNVLLVTMDTVRADHMSLYGYAVNTTPHLKQFAASATLYRDAVATGDMTLSSHASIFTGLYPTWHEAHYASGYPGGRPLDRRFQTLPQILARNGYYTAAVVANYPYLGKGFGLDRDFEYFDQRAPVSFLATSSPFLIRQRVRNLLRPFFPAAASERIFRNAEDINRSVFEALSHALKERGGVFCFVNYMDAHWPYLAPSQNSATGGKLRVSTDKYFDIVTEVLSSKHPISPRERTYLISQYDASLAYLDSRLGDLIAQLKARGLYDDWLIIVTSDHGEAFGAKGLVGHGVSVYQNQVHVPLLIKYPRASQGAVVEQRVSLVDLLPTVLGVCGIAVPKPVQGQSLLESASGSKRLIMSETFVHPVLSSWNARFRRTARALFTGTFKLISRSNGVRELYDLSKDPMEQQNVYSEAAGGALQTKLDRFVGSNRLSPGRVASKVNAETLEKLKSLGYVQ